MALTPIRWTVALLLVVVATLAVVSQPSGVEPLRLGRHRTPEAAAHSRAVAQLNRAKARLVEARLRDRVLAIVDATPGDGLQVHVSVGIPGAVELGAGAEGFLELVSRMESFFSEAVRSEWATMAEVSDPIMPVTFIVIPAPGHRRYSLRDPFVLILPSDSSERCIALLRFGVAARERIEDGMAIDAALRPRSRWWQPPVGLSSCAWYALFGKPEAGVARWLAATGFAYGVTVPGGTPEREVAHLEVAIDSLRMRGIGVLGLACSAGNEAACRQVLMGEFPRYYWQGRRTPHDMVAVRAVTQGFGPAQFHLLADMVADIGPEAFQRFWSSGRPIEDAFREATGAELMGWTRAWARRNVGPVGGGPMPAGATVAGGLLVVLLGLAVAAGRRGGRGGRGGRGR